MKYDFVKIGRRIAGERSRLGLNQDELIIRLSSVGTHVGRNTLSKIESGKADETNVPVGLLLAMCEVFGCELGYLLGEEGYRGRTRTDTDVFQITGLDATAVEGLKQIYSATGDWVDAHITEEYEMFYQSITNTPFDVRQVINWLFKNDSFKNLLCRLAYKLQTVESKYIRQDDFQADIKRIFIDYQKEGQPMLKADVVDLEIERAWDKLVSDLHIRPEDEGHAEFVINEFIRKLWDVLPVEDNE